MNTKNNENKLCLNSENVASRIAWRLNSVCELFETLYDVNCGGCCYLAYCLAKLLDSDNLEYQVVVVSDNCEELMDCETLSDIPCSCLHYGIYVGGEYINIDDSDLENDYVNHFINVTPDEIKEHYEFGDWNDCYDIDKNDLIWETLKTFYYDFTQDLREQ